MKKIITVISLLIIILIFTILPIMMMLKIEKLAALLCMDKAIAFNLFIAFLPFIFSIIIMIFGYIVEFLKNENELHQIEKEKINKQIKCYNLVMVKSIKRYNRLMNELVHMLDVKESFMKVPEFAQFIELWNKEIKNNIIYSNDDDFRNIIRQKIYEFISIYRNSNIYDTVLEFIGNMDLVFDEKETLNNDDSVFIHGLNNFLKLSKKDLRLLITYCDNLGDGNDNKRIICEFNKKVDSYKSSFESEIRNRNISDEKLYSLISPIFIKFFYLTEALLLDVFLLEEFHSTLLLNFEKYYKEVKDKFKILDEFIKIDTVYNNDFINKYLKKETVYDFYKI